MKNYTSSQLPPTSLTDTAHNKAQHYPSKGMNNNNMENCSGRGNPHKGGREGLIAHRTNNRHAIKMPIASPSENIDIMSPINDSGKPSSTARIIKAVPYRAEPGAINSTPAMIAIIVVNGRTSP